MSDGLVLIFSQRFHRFHCIDGALDYLVATAGHVGDLFNVAGDLAAGIALFVDRAGNIRMAAIHTVYERIGFDQNGRNLPDVREVPGLLHRSAARIVQLVL